MNLAHNNFNKYSYKDYKNWPDSERWEVINGNAFNMSPAPNRKHQKVSINLAILFGNYLKDKNCQVYAAPFDVLLNDYLEQLDEEITNIVQPDISVICDKTKLTDYGCKGAPDLVIEILSDSTVRKDMRDKYFLYETHGVKEYWIVNPSDKTITVFVLNKDNKYIRENVYFEDEEIKVNLFDELVIKLSDVFFFPE